MPAHKTLLRVLDACKGCALRSLTVDDAGFTLKDADALFQGTSCVYVVCVWCVMYDVCGVLCVCMYVLCVCVCCGFAYCR